LIEVTGRPPPEDIGGPLGFADLLAAIIDPNHKCRAEFANWIESGFDPNMVDAHTLYEAVETLATRWTRKPATRRARPK
jgi:hypothetical protein